MMVNNNLLLSLMMTCIFFNSAMAQNEPKEVDWSLLKFNEKQRLKSIEIVLPSNQDAPWGKGVLRTNKKLGILTISDKKKMQFLERALFDVAGFANQKTFWLGGSTKSAQSRSKPPPEIL